MPPIFCITACNTCKPGKKEINCRSTVIITNQIQTIFRIMEDNTQKPWKQTILRLHSSSTIKSQQFSAIQPATLVSPERDKLMLGLQYPFLIKCHQFSQLWQATLESPENKLHYVTPEAPRREDQDKDPGGQVQHRQDVHTSTWGGPTMRQTQCRNCITINKIFFNPQL